MEVFVVECRHRTNHLSLKYLKINSININSQISNQKRYSVLTLLNKEIPDLVLNSETKLNKIHKIHFKNYSLVRQDRRNTTQDQGTAILINNPLNFKVILRYKMTSFKILVTTVIKIKINNNKTYLSGYPESSFRFLNRR